MKSAAALLRTQPGLWEIADVEVSEPQNHEVLVRMVASGLCHSDDHVAKGDAPAGHLPFCGGHEGAGVIEAVGDDVMGLSVGDHIVTSFLPACGQCRFCRTEREYLCDRSGLPANSERFRMHEGSVPVMQCAGVGSFSELATMPEWACVRIDQGIALESAALVGCGVPTGWGSATNAARVQPGETVIVMGAGGVGVNAIQGAAYSGAEHVVAVDPVEMKRSLAISLGATDAAGSIAEAVQLLHENGVSGADAVIVTTGVATGTHVGEAFDALGRGGTVVLTAVANSELRGLPINLREMALQQKTVTGALLGQMNPSTDINKLLQLYQDGFLKLDELVSRRYALQDVNHAYEDLHAGEVLRGVITFS